MDKDLDQTWVLRNNNFKPTILLSTILSKGSSFGCLYEDPLRFKFMSDIWFEKHYRTFEKWFEAFDLPYEPLHNYLNKRKESQKTSEDSNKYNKYSDNTDVNSTHIGDSFKNEDLSDRTTEDITTNEVIDQDTTGSKTSKEITDIDTTQDKNYEESVNTVTDGTKNYTDEHDLSRTKDTDTKTDITATTTDNNRTSTTTPNLISENRVSAYNDLGDESGHGTHETDPDYGAYNPESLNINTGSTSTVGTGSTSVHTLTNNTDPSSNNVHEVENMDTDDHAYDESHEDETQVNKEGEEHITGTEDKTVDYTESTTGTMDQETNSTSNKIGTDTKNIKTTSNDKYNDGSNTKSDGDSSTKSNSITDKDIDAYVSGIIGNTAYQDLLAKEVNVQMFTIYDQMAELFCDEMCVRIYLSNRQRGGCCWW